MPEYKPFPLSAKMIKTLKLVTNISSDEEALRPSVVRKFFDDVAASSIQLPEVEKQDLDIEINNVKVNISILRPVGSKDKVLPTVFYLHGGGWVFGSYHTHGILTNELVNLIPCCVIFVNYSLSPEAKYPVALEECYAALCWVKKNAASIHVDPKRLAVAGDSAGGNLAAALTIYAKNQGNTDISCQVLYYPVADVDFNSESYEEHKNNVFLPRTTMQYMWGSYLESEEQYKIPTAVPMAAPVGLLKGIPAALIITAEKDVLRSEGELYGKKLIKAGVDTVVVRYVGVGHGFVSTPPLGGQALAAIAQTIEFLRKQWNSSAPKL